MNKHQSVRHICCLLVVSLSSSIGYAQMFPGVDDLVCGVGIETEIAKAGTYASTTTVLTGGREKTSVGTLKVLVIFVRFADDVTNTEYGQIIQLFQIGHRRSSIQPYPQITFLLI